jgi:hypothetical protein
VDDLKTNNSLDVYALKALEESAKWLKNSLDESLKLSMQYTLSIELSGPELWMAIVSEVMAESLQRVDDLRKEFENLKLSSFSGENVVDYCEKASNLLLQLERDDALPRLYLVTILDVFCDCTVMDFKIAFMGRRVAIEQFLREAHGKDKAAVASMTNRVTYQQLLQEGKYAYNNLKKRWGPASAVKENPEKAMLVKFEALEAKLKQALELKGDNGARKKNSNGKKCFDCGSEYHFKGAQECKKKGSGSNNNSVNNNNNSATNGGNGKDEFWKWPAPKDGEAKEKKTSEGKMIFWCSKCKKGNGKWNETHKTEGHTEGWLKKKKKSSASQSSANLAQSVVPTTTTWFE